ncbi:hypothetical protein BaRGS_00017372, partial [Batillaria attramentaria]
MYGVFSERNDQLQDYGTSDGYSPYSRADTNHYSRPLDTYSQSSHSDGYPQGSRGDGYPHYTLAQKRTTRQCPNPAQHPLWAKVSLLKSGTRSSCQCE